MESKSHIRKEEYSNPIVISVGGGGSYYVWELGALKAVQENLSENRIVFAAASAGAIAAAFTLCGVDPLHVMEYVAENSKRRGIDTRNLGYAFVWGPLVKEWLEDCLPENAAEYCRGRLVVHVTQWCGYRKGFKVRRIKEFFDKHSLIEAILASCHLPFLFNGKLIASLTADFGDGKRKEYQVVDGTFLSFFPAKEHLGINKESIELTSETGKKPDLFLTHSKDPDFKNRMLHTRLIFFGKEKDRAIFERGYEFTTEMLRSEAYKYLFS